MFYLSVVSLPGRTRLPAGTPRQVGAQCRRKLGTGAPSLLVVCKINDAALTCWRGGVLNLLLALDTARAPRRFAYTPPGTQDTHYRKLRLSNHECLKEIPDRKNIFLRSE